MTPRREKLILGAGVAIFILFSLAISLIKIWHSGYNGFDLAIYNQTFWNTVHGNWFAASIHPPSYLGDHAEWMILALAPFYAIIPHPFTLLFLKIVCVGLSAIPVWMIAKLKFSDARTRLLFPFIWLLNPYLWNTTLFEFHLITFAIPTTFLIAYFFLRERYLPFIIGIIILLLTREDMAFIAIGFGLLAGIDILVKRKKLRRLFQWTAIPIILAVAIFIIDQKIIGHFNPDGSYKFFLYYEWLGRTPKEIIVNAFLHPIRTFLHLIMPINFQIIFVLLLPVLFVPIFRPRFLVLILLTTAEYMLTKNGADLLIVKSQYSAAFLPAVMLATIEGYEWLMTHPWRFKIIPKPLTPVLLIAASIYTWYAFGPGNGLIKNLAPADARTRAVREAAELIPPDAPVVASMDTLTALSSRADVWPMNYFWIGKKQFGMSDYVLPKTPEYLVLDQRDIVYFTMVYPRYAWSEKAYPGRAANFKNFIIEGKYGTIFNKEGIAVFKRGVGGEMPFVSVYKQTPSIDHVKKIKTGPLTLLGWNQSAKNNITELFFTIDAKIKDDLALKINNEYYPLGSGIYPATDWNTGETIKVSVPISTPKMTIRPEVIIGGLNITSIGTIKLIIDKGEPAGDEIQIP